MKILYLTKYPRNAASSRLRSYQYFPYLEKNGFKVTVSPLFNEKYINQLYAKQPISKVNLISCYFKRFLILFTIKKFDKIVIEKELFPYFFSWIERVLCFLNIKYIVDYDDAIFHNYDLKSNKLFLFFLKNKIYNVMKYGGTVIAGNAYLAQKASQSGAENIVNIPTVIDINNYIVKKKEHKKVIVGWIGSPSTFKYVEAILPVITTLLSKFNIEFHIIGSKNKLPYHSNIKYYDWKEETEVELIANFDIGIMPLDNSPWELGKCSYKLIQYMGCGVAVVASPIGMNNEVVTEGENGFLADTHQDWIDKLSLLIENENLRNTMGENGRQRVAAHYCVQNSFSTLISVLNNG
jgi:glycosyltransferase involved in cell wall biosynthesis